MLPGFTGRVVPYAYQPEPPMLPISHMPPADSAEKPPPAEPTEPKPEDEPAAEAPAAARAPWWNPFAKKQPAEPAAPQQPGGAESAQPAVDQVSHSPPSRKKGSRVIRQSRAALPALSGALHDVPLRT